MTPDRSIWGAGRRCPRAEAVPGTTDTSPAALKALLAVLPVGGVTPDNMVQWRAAGARDFGIGSVF